MQLVVESKMGRAMCSVVAYGISSGLKSARRAKWFEVVCGWHGGVVHI